MGQWKKNLPIEREIERMNNEKIEKTLHLKVFLDTEGSDEGIL